jgi:hypothetical protein
MARSRIKGKSLSITVGTTKYECDLVSFVLEKADQAGGEGNDVITFCDASTGAASGQVWQLSLEALQSTDVTDATANPPVTKSLWSLLWDEADKGSDQEIDFELAPYGNATPSSAQPHFTGKFVVKAGDFPTIGGSAGDASWTFSKTYLVANNSVTRKTA